MRGITLTIGDHAYAVVGVMPPGFRLPDRRAALGTARAWTAIPSRTAHNWRVVGRLRDGVTIEQARSDLRGDRAAAARSSIGDDTTMVDVAVDAAAR